jgi:hypothetical protein
VYFLLLARPVPRLGVPGRWFSLSGVRRVLQQGKSIPTLAFLLLSFLVVLRFAVRSSESVWVPDLFLQA